MAYAVTVPRFGWTMEEGVFVEWLKQEGEFVESGEMLFTIEGEKSIQEVESIDSGILRIDPDGPQEGDTVLVGAALAYLVEADETPPFGQQPEAVVQAVATEAQSASVPPASRSHETPVNESSEEGSLLPSISPRAARVAAELGVDWRQLTGSGRTGRIRERDIRAAAETDHATGVAQPAPAGERATVSPGTIVPLSATRRTIAARMAASAQTTAPVTLTTTADATNLVALRHQFKSAAQSQPATIPSYTDLIVKLTATALRQHPLLNARWEENEIVACEEIQIGIAVDTDAGLLVPVVRDVPSLGIAQLAQRSHTLIERARRGQLTTEEMQGGTFTVTNLGAFGIDAFTPIINLPECAVLGIGRIRRQPAVVDDQVVPREMIALSLTFDHRIVDGAPAARFLESVRIAVEQPGPYLIS